MVNAVFPKARQVWAGGGINWGVGSAGDAIHVDLIDLADYTVSLSTHQFRSSVPAAARVSSAGPLTNKQLTDGWLDSDDPTFTAVVGDQAEAIIYWRNTGNDATSNLLIFIDQGSGLPVTPNSGAIGIVQPSPGIVQL